MLTKRSSMTEEGWHVLRAFVIVASVGAFIFVLFVVYYVIKKNREIRWLRGDTQAPMQADVEAQNATNGASVELSRVKNDGVNWTSVYDIISDRLGARDRERASSSSSSVTDQPAADSAPVNKAKPHWTSVYDLPGGDLGATGRDNTNGRDYVAAASHKTSGPTEQDVGTVRLDDVWRVASVAPTVAPDSPLATPMAGTSRAATVASVSDASSASSSYSQSVNSCDSGTDDDQSDGGRSQRTPRCPDPPPPSPVIAPTVFGRVSGNFF